MTIGDGNWKGRIAMPDREKVIFQLSEIYKLLEIVTPHFNQIVDYHGMIQGCKDAIALLNEQENASKRNPVIVCPHCGKRVK